jgi:predicted HTH transcriptional regulator
MPFLQKIFSGIDKSITENQLNALGILTSFGSRHVVTHGGLILFGKPDARQQVLPDARVSCARFS